MSLSDITATPTAVTVRRAGHKVKAGGVLLFETRFAVGDVVSIGSSGFQKYTCESFAPPAGVVVSVDRETETTLVKLTGEVPCSTET